MSKLVWKVGDTAPGQKIQLYGHSGVPDLTGATVVMHVKGVEDGIACEVADDDDHSPTDGVVHAGRGSVAPDSGRSRKTLEVEFQVTFGDGTIQTFPEDGYQQAEVWQDID